MKTIELNQLREFIHGCTEVRVEDGVLTLQRIAAPMAAIYNDQEGARIRKECTPGVRLRLRTDSQRLRLGLRFGASPRPQLNSYNCILFIDGVKTAVFGPGESEEPTDWESELFCGQGGMHEICVWFSHLARVDILSCAVGENAKVEAAPPLPKRWLVYGDSITQGMMARFPTGTLPACICLELGIDYVNLGVGGAKMEAELATSVPPGKFDLVSIAYGTNDFNQGRSVESFAANATALIEALREKLGEAPVILITPITWAGRTEPNDNGVRIDDFRAALKPVAEAFGHVRLVDGASLLPDDPSYFHDNVHPNDKGFALYAKNLMPVVKECIG